MRSTHSNEPLSTVPITLANNRDSVCRQSRWCLATIAMVSHNNCDCSTQSMLNTLLLSLCQTSFVVFHGFCVNLVAESKCLRPSLVNHFSLQGVYVSSIGHASVFFYTHEETKTSTSNTFIYILVSSFWLF